MSLVKTLCIIIKQSMARSAIGCIVLCALFGGAAHAQQAVPDADRSWINLRGTVAAARDDHFFLNYGKGVIRIEMDDWDWYGESAALSEGDEVVVHGRVDNNVYETKTVEAESVYVKGLNTFFYSSAIDEEDFDNAFAYRPLAESGYQVTGTVTSVSKKGFAIDAGKRKVKVDVSEMPYDPLDKLGFQRITEGDLVSVTGEVDANLFDRREVVANNIVTLVEDAGRSRANAES